MDAKEHHIAAIVIDTMSDIETAVDRDTRHATVSHVTRAALKAAGAYSPAAFERVFLAAIGCTQIDRSLKAFSVEYRTMSGGLRSLRVDAKCIDDATMRAVEMLRIDFSDVQTVKEAAQ